MILLLSPFRMYLTALGCQQKNRNIRTIHIFVCSAARIWVQRLNFNRKLLKYRNTLWTDGNLQKHL